MKIYTKFLLASLPLLLLAVLASGGIAWYLSRSVLDGMAERWMDSRIDEAIRSADRFFENGRGGSTDYAAQLSTAAAFESLTPEDQGILFAINKAGIITAHPEPEMIGTDWSREEWFQTLSQSGMEGSITLSFEGIPYLARFKQYSTWDWTIVAGAPESVIAQQVTNAGFSFSIFVILCAGITSTILIFVIRRITMPMELLELGAEEMSRGNFNIRIPIKSDDEIGSFARVFNQMANQLQHTLEALKESEQHYRALIEHSSDIIIVVTVEGVVVFVDPSVSAVLGYTPNEVVGRRLFNFVHPDDKAEVMDAFTQLIINEETPRPITLRARTRDGGWKDFEAMGTNLLNDPAINGIIVTLRDLAERKHREKVQASIYQISEAAFSSQNLKELFQQFHQIISQLMPADNFYVALYDEQNDLLAFPYFVDQYDTQPDPAPPEKGLTEYVLRTGEPLLAGPEKFDKMVTNGDVEPVGAPGIDWLGVPLKVNGKVLGVLVLQSYSTQVRFGEEDKEILTFVSEQAAMAIARKQAEEAAHERHMRYQELFESSPVALWEEDFSAINGYIQKLRDAGIQDFRWYFMNHPEAVAECMSLVRVIDVNQTAVRIYRAHNKAELLRNIDRVFGRESLDVVTDQLVAIADGAQAFEGNGMNYRLDGTKFSAIISWQISPAFAHTMSQVIVSLVDISGRMEAEENAKAQIQRINALRAIDMSISASLDLRATLNVLLEQVSKQLKVDAAAVLLLDPHVLTLDYAAGRGFRTAALQHTRLRLGEGYAGRAALERNLVMNPNLNESPGNLKSSPLLIEEGFIAYFAVPLIAKGQVKGVLEIFHRAPLNPAQEWLDFLETLGRQAAIAIDNASLFNDLQRSNIELSLAYDATIEGWSRALDMRDRETEGHTQRVTEMTLRLAQMMAVSKASLGHMRWGALLHDIGKMGIPDSILLKPGPLTKEERVIMRMHPVYAYEMLLPIAYLRPALDIPYYHHEKWNGTGYPCKLRREEIPLAARIFSVVDVWDALSSDRPYRQAWTKEKVRQFIVSQSEKHFDPRIVEAFLEVIRTEEL